MEVDRKNSMADADNNKEEDEEVPLPGFRFHPTDEELVGFYLRRKVEKKPISIELIKQIDIYKYDPWDLPNLKSHKLKFSRESKHSRGSCIRICKKLMIIAQEGGNVGDKEWYFFCRRGRKYRNSIRPNRVTGSGFWKATGIDRPIYSADEGRDCIGLKKSLVYYIGCAGKGTKTDWMMHEFRLPPVDYNKSSNKNDKQSEVKLAAADQEAEVWTLCRILKRNVSYRKGKPDWREVPTKRNNAVEPSSKCSSSIDSVEGYISFSNPIPKQNENQPIFQNANHLANMQLSSLNQAAPYPSILSQAPPVSPASSYPSVFNPVANEQLLKYGDWDELRTVTEFATDALIM